jgi:hypothetical protein
MSYCKNVSIVLLISLLVFVPIAQGIHPNWVQVNHDGFFGHSPSLNMAVPSTLIFTFGSNLYARDNQGLYSMNKGSCLEWEQLSTPTAPSESWIFSPIGEQLYLTEGDQLWFIKSGSNWVKVSSVGLPSGVSLVPMALFNGQIYAAVYSPGIAPGISTRDTFSIWRSQDVGKPVMQWSQVVSGGFNNPDNHDLASMLNFNNKIIAVTTITCGGSFGDERYYGKGIQVWESASGDPGSWTQVNQNGFGTEVTLANPTQTFLKNQDAGGCAVAH